MKRYFWDFFGPRAEGTARHFLVHLRQFLHDNGCPELPVGLCSEGTGHHAVFCSAPPALESALERSLRPRRSTEG